MAGSPLRVRLDRPPPRLTDWMNRGSKSALHPRAAPAAFRHEVDLADLPLVSPGTWKVCVEARAAAAGGGVAGGRRRMRDRASTRAIRIRALRPPVPAPPHAQRPRPPGARVPVRAGKQEWPLCGPRAALPVPGEPAQSAAPAESAPRGAGPYAARLRRVERRLVQRQLGSCQAAQPQRASAGRGAPPSRRRAQLAAGGGVPRVRDGAADGRARARRRALRQCEHRRRRPRLRLGRGRRRRHPSPLRPRIYPRCRRGAAGGGDGGAAAAAARPADVRRTPKPRAREPRTRRPPGSRAHAPRAARSPPRPPAPAAAAARRLVLLRPRLRPVFFIWGFCWA